MGCTWSLLALSSIIWHPIGVVKRQPAWLIDQLANKLAAEGAAFSRQRAAGLTLNEQAGMLEAGQAAMKTRASLSGLQASVLA
jgi:hypothetical protein